MEKVYEFLAKIHPNTDFRSSENFIDDGLLDSLDIIELIDMICEEYNIEIYSDDIDPDNFSTAEDIYKMIEKY